MRAISSILSVAGSGRAAGLLLILPRTTRFRRSTHPGTTLQDVRHFRPRGRARRGRAASPAAQGARVRLPTPLASRPPLPGVRSRRAQRARPRRARHQHEDLREGARRRRREGEYIVRGGRHLFEKLPEALAGIETIGVIGWGSQAPRRRRTSATLAEASMSTKVCIGLRPPQINEEARALLTEDGTLGGPWTSSPSRTSCALISTPRRRVFPSPPPRSPARRSASATASSASEQRRRGLPRRHQRHPRRAQGHGHLVAASTSRARRLAARASTSFAVPGRDRTPPTPLGWSIVVGSPRTFATTLEMYRPTSSASATTCSAASTASSSRCTAAT